VSSSTQSKCNNLHFDQPDVTKQKRNLWHQGDHTWSRTRAVWIVCEIERAKKETLEGGPIPIMVDLSAVCQNISKEIGSKCVNLHSVHQNFILACVPRRPKNTLQRTEWPKQELSELFGEHGDERDLDEWAAYVKRTWPTITSPLGVLIAAGCDRRHLVRVLCELHASRRWESFSRAELKACGEAITRAERIIRSLTASELRYHLLLTNWNPDKRPRAPLHSLVLDLYTLSRRIDLLPWGTSRRERLLRNELLGYLSAYVKWATGELHLDDLEAIVSLLIGGSGHVGHKFSMRQWRVTHRKFWEVPPKVKAAWTRAAKAGIIQEPIWHSRQPGGWSDDSLRLAANAPRPSSPSRR
jgi:hypothetical protein